MIRFNFSIRNPWTKDSPESKTYFSYESLLNKNWGISIQCSQMGCYDLLGLELDLSWRGEDHAGPCINVEILGYLVRFKIYNTKHWDYDNGTWEKKHVST